MVYGWILLFYSIFYSIILNAISAKLISEDQKIWIKGRIEEDRKGKINKRCKNGISSKYRVNERNKIKKE